MKRDYENAREKRNEAENKRRRWLADKRRRRKLLEEEKRRAWLWVLFLLALDNIDRQVRLLIASLSTRRAASPQPAPPRVKDYAVRIFDVEEHLRRDYAPRRGEEHLEVCDGLTHLDIQQIKESHRPPIPGLPSRYNRKRPHVWTLLDHLRHDFLRKDAITALKMQTPRSMHAWLDECAISSDWRYLRMCRRATPAATIAAMPRAMWLAQEDKRQEAEERKNSLERANSHLSQGR